MGGGWKKMKRDGSKTLFAVVLFVTLGLFILNPAFAGSDCNRVCEGSFVIDDINSAADLKTLSGCTSVTGDLSIIDTPLTSLKGLECLAHVGGRLDITANRSLKSLEGLNRFESVGGDLEMMYNFSLISLAGLNNLKSVGGRLDIEQNELLTSIKSLGNITSIGGDLEISSNFSLTSLAGLNNLKSVGGRLDISVNRSLTSLAGLNNLKSVGGDLAIWYNRELCTSLAEALRDRLLGSGGTGRSIKVSFNKTGC
jgi:hypothetical protein